MASAPTHIVASAAIAAGFHRPVRHWQLWTIGAVLSVMPDLDVIGFRFGIQYGDLLGHRGLSHSLFAAAVISGIATEVFYRLHPGVARRAQIWVFMFLAMVSHGVLDALTNGGLGVAFFAPFNDERYFFPFRPLKVSPLSLTRFLTRGPAILATEIRWVWVPSVIFIGIISWIRYRIRPAAQTVIRPES
jgi:inner membrane protein